MNHRSVGLVALIVFAASFAHTFASDVEKNVLNTHIRCSEEMGLPGAIAGCIRERETRHAEELDAAYGRLLRVLDGRQKELLRSSQRGWLNYQTDTCSLVGNASRYESPGVPFPAGYALIATNLCLLRTTLTRLDELAILAGKRP